LRLQKGKRKKNKQGGLGIVNPHWDFLAI